MAKPLERIERIASRLRGETRRAKAIKPTLEAKSAQVARLSPGLQTIITEAASRGSSRTLDSLDQYSGNQRFAVEAVADLMMNGGFIAVPYLSVNGPEGGMRFHDATVIQMTPEAQRELPTSPNTPKEIGPFKRLGNDDITDPQIKQTLERLGIRESDLPVIEYEPVVHLPEKVVGRGRVIPATTRDRLFRYDIFYIPPGTHKELDPDGKFRGSQPEDSQKIWDAIYGAIGRELADSRPLGGIRDTAIPEPVVPSSQRVGARMYVQRADEAKAVRSANAAGARLIESTLEGERARAHDALDPLVADMRAISTRFLFPRRRMKKPIR